LFAFVVALIFVIFGKPLLAFAFGPGLVEAYPSLLILLVGQLFNSFVGSVGYLLNMAGYEKDVLKITGVSTILISILTLTITPIWGIIGGAIASSATLIISQIVMHKLVHNKLGIVSHMFGKIK
jgi:O-antigen/teichoic acid export membrane protein